MKAFPETPRISCIPCVWYILRWSLPGGQKNRAVCSDLPKIGRSALQLALPLLTPTSPSRNRKAEEGTWEGFHTRVSLAQPGEVPFHHAALVTGGAVTLIWYCQHSD